MANETGQGQHRAEFRIPLGWDHNDPAFERSLQSRVGTTETVSYRAGTGDSPRCFTGVIEGVEVSDDAYRKEVNARITLIGRPSGYHPPSRNCAFYGHLVSMHGIPDHEFTPPTGRGTNVAIPPPMPRMTHTAVFHLHFERPNEGDELFSHGRPICFIVDSNAPMQFFRGQIQEVTWRQAYSNSSRSVELTVRGGISQETTSEERKWIARDFTITPNIQASHQERAQDWADARRVASFIGDALVPPEDVHVREESSMRRFLNRALDTPAIRRSATGAPFDWAEIDRARRLLLANDAYAERSSEFRRLSDAAARSGRSIGRTAEATRQQFDGISRDMGVPLAEPWNEELAGRPRPEPSEPAPKPKPAYRFGQIAKREITA